MGKRHKLTFHQRMYRWRITRCSTSLAIRKMQIKSRDVSLHTSHWGPKTHLTTQGTGRRSPVLRMDMSSVLLSHPHIHKQRLPQAARHKTQFQKYTSTKEKPTSADSRSSLRIETYHFCWYLTLSNESSEIPVIKIWENIKDKGHSLT